MKKRIRKVSVMRFRRICGLANVLMLTVLIGFGAASASAAECCRINVTTILAGCDDSVVDHRLLSQIDELQAIFKYTSYRLLGSENIKLETTKNGKLDLPGKHEISIDLERLNKKRAVLDIHLSRQNDTVFQMNVQLLNEGNLFVGGPKYLNGNLIFKISSAF